MNLQIPWRCINFIDKVETSQIALFFKHYHKARGSPLSIRFHPFSRVTL